MNGILCIDKPQGLTSFDVVARLRKVLGTKKIGHAGTLDPMATGVLPVFVGTATRACGILPDEQKAYTAGFRVGVTTDTGDVTGEVLSHHSVRNVSDARIELLLRGMTGEIMQVPPMYSAVKVGGKRLYELAREGKTVERRPRKVRIDKLELTDFAGRDGILKIECGAGTYVRSVIEDLGERLGCGAVMTSLRRTRACGYELKDCLTLEDTERLYAKKELKRYLIPAGSAFASLPAARLSENQARLYKNGVRLSLSDFPCRDGVRCAVYGPEGFLGTAIPREGKLYQERAFFGGGEG